MADQRDPDPTQVDTGTAPPQPAAQPTAPTGAQPAPATNPNAPQPTAPAGAPSNKPDVDTAAAASIPAKLVNNPAVPTQKMAFDADANKTSPAPHHSWIHAAAEALAGGPRFQYQVDDAGNMVKTQVPVSTAHLGLAIALEAIKGAAAGAGQRGPGAEGRAAAAGLKQGESDQNKIQQQDQQARQNATEDAKHKQDLTEANFRIHQMATLVGDKDKETSQAFADSFKPLADAVDNGTINIPGTQRMFESEVADGIKNGKFNVTNTAFVPYGQAQPVMENGQQKVVNGVPVWGHNYLVIPNSATSKVALTDQIQKSGHEVGMFLNADGSPANIGTPDWSFADIAQKMSSIAQIKAGEQLLQLHKNDAHDLIGKPVEDLDSLPTAVRNNPQMRTALQLYSKMAGTDSIDTILGRMNATDPQSASLLMQYLKLTPKDMEDMANARLKSKTAATAEAKADATAAAKNTPEQQALVKARTQQALSATAKNQAETNKVHADIDKALKGGDDQDAIVDAFGTGHVAAANMAYILRSKEGQALLTKVTAKYPDFDSSKAGAYPKVYDEFTSTKKGTAGGAINNGATAFKHLRHLLDLNTNESHIPGTPEYKAYESQMNTLVDELGQFYGNSTIPGLEGFKDTLNSTLPGSREASIRQQAHAMGEKMDSYAQQWKNAAPSKSYEAPMPWYDSAAQAARASLQPKDQTSGQPTAPQFSKVSASGKFGWDGKQWVPIGGK